MDQVYIPKVDYKVLVRCFTYNQSKYIEDALNGFAMQQTDFPFVCLVMDDCSTDGEQNAIKAWMERECDMEKAENLEIEKSFITLVPHKTNANCHFAFYFLKQNLYGTGEKKMCMVTPWREHCEYEALCEGDDYWIHSSKLQLQSDYLDAHADYSMCFHNAILHWEDNTHEDSNFSALETREYSSKELLQEWITPTASFVMRKEYLSIIDAKDIDFTKIIHGDNLILLSNLCVGKIYAFADSMSVYRKQEGGMVYNKSINHHLRYCEQLSYCSKKFPQFRKYFILPLSLYNFQIFQSYCSDKNFILSAKYLIKSFLIKPDTCLSHLFKYIAYRMHK